MIFFKNPFFKTAFFATAALTAGTSAFAEEGPAETGAAPAEQAVAAPAAVPAEENAHEAAMKALRESIEKLNAERAKLEAEQGLADAKLEQELLPQKLEKARLDAERALRSASFAEKLAAIEEERAKLERELALATARADAKLRAKQRRLAELEADSRELQAQVAALNNELAAPAALYSKKLETEKIASAAPKYLKEPLVDGTLYISDRRVDFNGPVTPESAARICRQIAFFNTRDTEYPIFLVIDNSPGGSVMAGYQIQKAMQSSRAPVYVVVKGMAASMAAVVATTAERSYCFANTKILHHQISSVFPRANLTSLRESMRTTEEVYRMFIGPVAKKLGISIEEMTKQMYEHNSDGDWEVFGTEAVERRWIDFLVARVEETAVVALGSSNKSVSAGPRAETEAEASLESLPPLENPFDRWWISGVK